MIIVAGRLRIIAGRRADFLASSKDAMLQARRTLGCRDFVVAADPLEEDRVNVYEEWESADALNAFRGDGPSDSLHELIVEAEVEEHEVPEA